MSPVPCWARWNNQSNRLLVNVFEAQKHCYHWSPNRSSNLHTQCATFDIQAPPFKSRNKTCYVTKLEESNSHPEYPELLAWVASAFLPLSYDNQAATSSISLYVLHRWCCHTSSSHCMCCVCDWGISVPLVQVQIEDCEGWWLSSCCNSSGTPSSNSKYASVYLCPIMATVTRTFEHFKHRYFPPCADTP